MPDLAIALQAVDTAVVSQNHSWDWQDIRLAPEGMAENSVDMAPGVNNFAVPDSLAAAVADSLAVAVVDNFLAGKYFAVGYRQRLQHHCHRLQYRCSIPVRTVPGMPNWHDHCFRHLQVLLLRLPVSSGNI